MPRRFAWASLPDEDLLDLRLRDLKARHRGDDGSRVHRAALRELAERRSGFRPHFWLSDEWFTPDGVPGVAVPVLPRPPAPRAARAAQMLEVEGGTPEWCMRILRHETGHAIDNAYRLRRRRAGARVRAARRSATRSTTRRKPYSQSYVVHLEPGTRRPSGRGLRRDVRGLARAALGLAEALRRLAGAEEARVRRRADGRDRARAARA